jgi:hypothetical protein
MLHAYVQMAHFIYAPFFWYFFSCFTAVQMYEPALRCKKKGGTFAFLSGFLMVQKKKKPAAALQNCISVDSGMQ